MTIPKLKKGWIITIVIILIFSLSNPSLRDFYEHEGDKDGRRLYNFLIFSVYEDGNETDIAVLLNFFKLP
jgi:hypothetical protein